MLQKTDKEDTYHESSDSELCLKTVDAKESELDTGTYTFLWKRCLCSSFSPYQQFWVPWFIWLTQLLISSQLRWLGNLFHMAYIISAIPASFLIEWFRLKFAMIFVSLLNVKTCCLRMGSCFFGQVIGAFWYAFIL